MRLFAQFTKVDDEQRIVGGTFTSETLDNQNDIVDFAATKAAVADYSQWRNVREMHQSSAVGTAVKIELDEQTQKGYMEAKIVDDAAWKKAKEGVYKGFSIGGKIVEAVKEAASGARRITKYVLNEVSLVDRPANPDAVFSMVKREGIFEFKKESAPAGCKCIDCSSVSSCPLAGTCPPCGVSGCGNCYCKCICATCPNFKTPTMQMGAKAEDLRKAVDDMGAILEAKLAKAVADATQGLAKAEDLSKVAEDIVKAAGKLTELEGRVKAIEDQPQPGGPMFKGQPVDKSVAGSGIDVASEEVVLTKMAGEITDPVLKDAIGKRLAFLEIKRIQGGR